jgi:hypothetical protein
LRTHGKKRAWIGLLDVVMEKEVGITHAAETIGAGDGNNKKEQVVEAANIVETPSDANEDDHVYPPLSKIVALGATMTMVILLVILTRDTLTVVSN